MGTAWWPPHFLRGFKVTRPLRLTRGPKWHPGFVVSRRRTPLAPETTTNLVTTLTVQGLQGGAPSSLQDLSGTGLGASDAPSPFWPFSRGYSTESVGKSPLG